MIAPDPAAISSVALVMSFPGLSCHRRSALVPPDVLLVSGDALDKRIGAADPPEHRRDLAVIQVWMVTAIAADDLVRVGVAAFRTARHDTGRPAP